MEFKEIGRVHAYLLENRIIETKPVGRRALPNERDMADIMLQLDYDEQEALNLLLSSQGLILRQFTDMDAPGLARGGRTWMLLRDPHSSSPSYISSEAVIKSIALRDIETIEKTSIWFLHIWLTFLAILYSHTGRSVSEVSRYNDSFFTREQLIEAVGEHIEQLRSIGVSGGVDEKVFEALDSEKGKDVPRRVAAFLKMLEDSKLILSTGENEYQQTLLGAVEMAENYSRSLGIIIPDSPQLENIVNMAADQNRAEQEEVQ